MASDLAHEVTTVLKALDPRAPYNVDIIENAIIAPWAKAKKQLINHFGPSLRMKVPSHFSPPSDEMGTRYFTDHDLQSLLTVAECGEHTLYALAVRTLTVLAHRVSAREIADNRLTAERTLQVYDGFKWVFLTLAKDIRLGRALTAAIRSQFASRLSKDAVELLANWTTVGLSRMTARLVTPAMDVWLSVHPVDILLSSLHTNGWTSCHNLSNGQYRSGNLAYVLDGRTIIAYTSREEREFLQTDLVLPVKQWRELVFVNHRYKSVIFGRQYPGRSLAAQQSVETATLDQAASMWKVSRDGFVTRDVAARRGGWAYPDHPERSFQHDTSTHLSRTTTMGTRSIPCPICGKDRQSGEPTGNLRCGACV